jgi:hypothetical protein
MQINMSSITQPIRNLMQAIPGRFKAVYQIALKVLSNFKAYCFTSNVTGLVEAAQEGKVENIRSLLALAQLHRADGKRGISKKDYDAAWHAAIRGGHIAALKALNQFDSTCPVIWWEEPVNNHECYYITSATTAALAGHIELLKYFLGKLKIGFSLEHYGQITKGVLISITDIGTRNKISEVLNNCERDSTNSQWVHYPTYKTSHARFLDQD